MVKRHLSAYRDITQSIQNFLYLYLFTPLPVQILVFISSFNVILKYADNTYIIIPAFSQSASQFEIQNIDGWVKEITWNLTVKNHVKLFSSDPGPTSKLKFCHIW